MKETMIERNSNPEYYEKIECGAEGCRSTEDLLVHKYTGEHMCPSCVNKLEEKIRKEKEQEHEEIFGARIYPFYGEIEQDFNELLIERNA
jgi:hypothetical protein